MKTSSSKKSQRKSVRPTGSAELLLEIGTEELPFEFIVPALMSLQEHAERLLSEARLSSGSIKTYGTPRRLVLVVEGLALHQAAVVKEAMGPSKAVAFDQAGQPTKAAMGFATGQGVSVESLEVRQTAKGDYLFAVKQDAGRPTKTVLMDLLPQLVARLSFPKAMKWNETGVRFARPVRWLVALFAGNVVPVETAGIKAGDRTYGHRVMGSGKSIAVRDFKTYSRGLERQGVLVDPECRRRAIEEQLDRLCEKAGVGLNADASLLDQAVYTTEWPCAIIGNFKPEYLAVPPEILITSMKEHQGFFSVRDKKSGKLAAHFIAVANNQLKDMSLIRAGNERVLAARLADAKFFFDEDRRIKLAERAKKLSGVTFHQKLGTMAQKQERISKLIGVLVEKIADSVGHPIQVPDVSVCQRAANLCKADLLTGIVGEFPELQGIMGGEYAKHDGEPLAVSQAIREQYLPRSIEGELPNTVEGQVLSLADRLDSLAAFFHVGIVPTGSEDPYALRRHATAIVRILLEGAEEILLDLGQVVEKARKIVAEGAIREAPLPMSAAQQRFVDFLFERVRHYGRTVCGLRDDVMKAVLGDVDRQSFELRDLLERMKALQAMTGKPEFDPLIVGFKRAHRLVEKEKGKDWAESPVDTQQFQHPSEGSLYGAIQERRTRMLQTLQQMRAGQHGHAYDNAIDILVELKPAIDTFFEAVMVNTEDPVVRRNRLSLLKEVDDLFMSFADFSQIVVQGS
jgi:glycyl-tRNA synthetase beta chain